MTTPRVEGAAAGVRAAARGTATRQTPDRRAPGHRPAELLAGARRKGRRGCPRVLRRHLHRRGQAPRSGTSEQPVPATCGHALADDAAVPSRRRPRAAAELALLLAVYAAYSAVRVLADVDAGTARSNGLAVLSLERALGIDVEAEAVQWLVRSTALSVAAGYAYAALHYTVTPVVLLWLYRARPERYAAARTSLLLASCAALLGYWLLPTAPPRLLSDVYPDVLALTSGYGWWGAEASAPRGLGTLTNQYAAMPSMHVGWAVWCGLTVAATAHRTIVRAAALSYPGLIALVVVVTANHFVLDAVAGAGLVVVLMTLTALTRRASTRLAWQRTSAVPFVPSPRGPLA